MVKNKSNKVSNGIHKYLRSSDDDDITEYRAKLFVQTYSLVASLKKDLYFEKKSQMAAFDNKRKLNGSLTLIETKERSQTKKEVAHLVDELEIITTGIDEMLEFIYTMTPQYDN